MNDGFIYIQGDFSEPSLLCVPSDWMQDYDNIWSVFVAIKLLIASKTIIAWCE